MVGADGIPIETFPLGEAVSIESVAAEMLALVKAGENPRGMGPKAPIRELVLVNDDSRILLSRVSPGYYLLLLLGEDGGVGRGRFELARAALGLEKELV
jgi:predicted regulator of Ras-like GTPase activity (Roadblock/LC7/MglB family)